MMIDARRGSSYVALVAVGGHDMSRYTINIGDDFPLDDDNGSGRGRGPRFGTILKVLFFVAVLAIVVSHPVKVALVVGLVLLLRRSGWWARMRAEWAARRNWNFDAWRGEAQRWAASHGNCCGGRYQEFV
jgi:hypothetical protein